MAAAVDVNVDELFDGVCYAHELTRMGIRVDGEPVDFKAYPYLIDMLDDEHPNSVTIKGGQMGFTITAILKRIKRLRQSAMRGCLYLFPTDTDVRDFSDARFARMMRDNPAFAALVRESVDSKQLKEIGEGYIYFRGCGQKGQDREGKKSKSKLKSIPIDDLVTDERDEMDDARVDAAMYRLSGSKNPRYEELSTPTIPDYGVDLTYQQSDQHEWHWKCQRCNEYVCLDHHWPNCLTEHYDDRPQQFLCSKCREVLERRHGMWIAARPDFTKRRGRRVSQLSSPRQTADSIFHMWVEAQHKGRMREFENQTLARPYAEVEQRLSEQMLRECVESHTRQIHDPGPGIMGVDPGANKMHYWVGKRVGKRKIKITKVGRCADMNDLHNLTVAFNVRVGVMDIGAETRKVREFLNEHPGWWGCQYVTKKTKGYEWDARRQVVQVDRTEALDHGHAQILHRNVGFHQISEEWDRDVVPQMRNLAKAKKATDEEGNESYTWVVVGGVKNDHYRHAFTYLCIASEIAPIARPGPARRRKTGREAGRSFMSV